MILILRFPNSLSFLGFNADVFLGKFDDNKYVADMKKKTTVPPGHEVKPRDEDFEILKKKMKDMLSDAGLCNPGKFLTGKNAKDFKLTELSPKEFQEKYDEWNAKLANGESIQ